MTAAGGGAPAVIISIRPIDMARQFGPALSIMFMTTGAPQRWVTPLARDRLEDRAGLDPAQADMGPRQAR